MGFQRDTDTALALGITPIAMVKHSVFPSGNAPWVESALTGPMPELLDAANGIPFETIAGLRPDLVLATDDYELTDNYVRLTQIAPTVSYVNGVESDTWQQRITHIGKALGRDEQAQHRATRRHTGRDVSPGKRYSWVAGEPGMVRALRQHLVTERGDEVHRILPSSPASRHYMRRLWPPLPGGSLSAPDPNHPYPLPDHERFCVFLRPTLTSEKVSAGEYTYYDASQDTGSFEEEHVLYGFGPEQLVIGKFCSIAAGVRFVMAAANHLSSGPSTFPFTIFPGRWQDETREIFLAHNTSKGDTVVGNDVWFGRDVTVMPGVTIGNGAIIATAAVVTRDVKPYTVVGGNPAGLIRQRYSDADVELLQQSAWWNWPVDLISEHAGILMAGTPAEIADIAHRHSLIHLAE